MIGGGEASKSNMRKVQAKQASPLSAKVASPFLQYDRSEIRPRRSGAFLSLIETRPTGHPHLPCGPARESRHLESECCAH